MLNILTWDECYNKYDGEDCDCCTSFECPHNIGTMSDEDFDRCEELKHEDS